MKGYIYRLYEGADPAKGWIMNDPIFGRPPTLGACVPNVRRLVEPGDWIFCISGRVENYRPFVVGGMRVAEKISALAAYERFPAYRIEQNGTQNLGNVIVTSDGSIDPRDNHKGAEGRIDNYIVGDQQEIVRAAAIEQAREETLAFLGQLFNKPGNRVHDVIGRWRKLDAGQIDHTVAWIRKLNGENVD